MTHLQILEKPQNYANDDDNDGLTQKEDAFEDLSVIVDNLDNANGMSMVTVGNLWYQLELQSLHVVERRSKWTEASIVIVNNDLLTPQKKTAKFGDFLIKQ